MSDDDVMRRNTYILLCLLESEQANLFFQMRAFVFKLVKNENWIK